MPFRRGGRSGGSLQGRISQYTPCSRIRRAMSWVYWPPKSRTRTRSWPVWVAMEKRIPLPPRCREPSARQRVETRRELLELELRRDAALERACRLEQHRDLELAAIEVDLRHLLEHAIAELHEVLGLIDRPDALGAHHELVEPPLELHLVRVVVVEVRVRERAARRGVVHVVVARVEPLLVLQLELRKEVGLTRCAEPAIDELGARVRVLRGHGLHGTDVGLVLEVVEHLARRPRLDRLRSKQE